MRALVVLILLAGACGGPVLAQVRVPDAGILQQETERRRAPTPGPGSAPPVPKLEEPAQPAPRSSASSRFFVKGFRIARNTAIPESELLPLLAGFAGKEQSLADLQRAAEAITRYYRERGYFVARAYLAAQELRDNIVEITVLEGTVAGIRLKAAPDLRLRPGLIEETVRAAIPANQPVTSGALDRVLLILSDLPGVEARAVLSPGEEFGTTVVTTEVSEGPLFSATIDADNFGNKFSGRDRLGATAYLNDPLGIGDQFSLRAIVSSGTQYGRLAYTLPAGRSGLRAGVSYSRMDYRLCCEFAPLEAEGTAETLTLNTSYPFVRSRNFNLYGSAAADRRSYVNTTVVGNTSDKRASVLLLGLAADSRDGLGSGGLNSAGFTLSTGRLDLDRNPGDAALDAATARSQGGYAKVAYSLARLQSLGGASSLYAAVSGQVASKNLDSSEKFLLGGPFGVRAYPVGEAAGDAGILVNLEYRYEMRAELQLVGFVDYGAIRLHQNPWAGWQGPNTRIQNSYSLSGGGIGLNWIRPGSFSIRASVAQRFGDNPGRDMNDNDADATRNRTQFWLQGIKQF